MNFPVPQVHGGREDGGQAEAETDGDERDRELRWHAALESERERDFNFQSDDKRTRVDQVERVVNQWSGDDSSKGGAQTFDGEVEGEESESLRGQGTEGPWT